MARACASLDGTTRPTVQCSNAILPVCMATASKVFVTATRDGTVGPVAARRHAMSYMETAKQANVFVKMAGAVGAVHSTCAPVTAVLNLAGDVALPTVAYVLRAILVTIAKRNLPVA